MGGQPSQSVRTTKNFYFGDVVKKTQFGKDLIIVTKPILNQEQYQEWKQKVDCLHEMNKDSLYVPESHQYKKINKGGLNACCGADSEVQITYEDISYLFASEIQNRRKNKNFYPQEQLILILYHLLLGAKEFQKRNLKFGDIRPKNILITNSKQLKMINVGSFPWQITSMEKVMDKFDNKTVFYFAPQEVQYIASRGYSKDKFPTAKTQAWSIGLTLLEAATLQSSEGIYKMPQRQIIEKELQNRLKIVAEKFPNLYPFMFNIIKIDSNQRMSSGEGWAAMRPYSEKITELQPFYRNTTAENNSIKKFRGEK